LKVMLVAFLVARVGDLVVRGAIGHAFTASLAAPLVGRAVHPAFCGK
jgi:hypothetical protein